MEIRMENFFIRDIVSACGGVLLCGSGDTKINNFATNSQKSEPGLMFVPIVGERVDGHRFIRDAFEHGASAAFTASREAVEDLIAEWALKKENPKPIVLTEDTVAALQKTARAYESRLNLPKIGVTGSVGKTTTKEMIACALSGGLRVFKTAGNLNSQIGVPITLMSISSEDEAAVIEMGMSKEGEMECLAALLSLDAVVMTNIGVSHIEQLRTQENILREKWHITDALKPHGKIFLNGDDALLRKKALQEMAAGREGVVTFGCGENCDYRAKDIAVDEKGIFNFTACYKGTELSVHLKVPGTHNVQNALAALAVAEEFGVDGRAAAERLGGYTGISMRQQIAVKNGIIYIDDSYNASPDSMRAGLNVLMQTKAMRRIAVLADMLELGEQAEEFHRQVGEYAGRSGIDELVLYGELSKFIGYGAEQYTKKIGHFDSLDEIKDYLKKNLKSGDAVLFKASRGMKLNEVAEFMIS